MARSTNIYLAMGANGQTLAAFTARHELIEWLSVGGRHAIDILSFRDGPKPQIWDGKDLRDWEPALDNFVSIADQPEIAALLRNAPNEIEDDSVRH